MIGQLPKNIILICRFSKKGTTMTSTPIQIVQGFIDRQLEAGNSANHQLLCNVRDKIKEECMNNDPDTSEWTAEQERAAVVAFLQKIATDETVCHHKPNREAAALFRFYIERGDHIQGGAS
jgi:hypothetical protein